MYSSILFLGAALAKLSAAAYVLKDDYEPSNFFSMFSFFTVSYFVSNSIVEY